MRFHIRLPLRFALPSALGALFFAAYAAPPASGQAAPDSARATALARSPSAQLPFDSRAKMGQLANGMRFYIRANTRPQKRAELRLVVNVGSMQEDDDQLGLAHVLEHMAFNGTRRFAKQQIVDFIERAGMTFGADLNAGTSFDETVYMLQMPSDTGNYVGRALDWFADIAGGGITLDSLELAKERPVVIEEWRLGKGAAERIQQQQFPVLFKDSRYASRLPIGTKESLDRFTRAQVLRLYQEWYRPELMAIVAVGDFNADSVEQMIRARFEPIARATAGARARVTSPVPQHTETLVAITTDFETSQSDVSVLWKQPLRVTRTVADYQRDLAVSLFLSMINQRFDEIVRKPNAPFIGAGASQGRLVRTSEAFSLDATATDGGIERALTATMTEAERVRQHGFTSTEFERQKTALLRSLEIQLNERDKTESGTFASRYVNHFLTEDPQIGIEVRAPLIRALLPAVTLAQVNAIAREWLVDQSRVILASAPPGKPGAPMPTPDALRTAVSRARSTTVTAYVDSETGAELVASPPTPGRIVAERRIEAIDVTEWTLSNGARVLVKATDFKADEVLVGGISLGGVGGLPPARFFSGQIGPQLLERGGLGTLDAVALRNKLTGKAVNASAGIDPRTESISGRGSPGDIETLFQLIWARVRTPRVDTAAVTAFKQQFGAFFRNRSNQPQTVYFDTVQVTMSQGHPIARPISSGLIDSLDVRVGLEVFNDRFRDFSDFTFVVVGAVKLEILRPLVERWIASLPGGGRRETPSEVDVPPPTGSIQKVVRKGVEPQAQSHVFLTGKTEWTRDAAMATSAISEILMIRLREVLREDLGGTYGSGFGTSIDRINGRFQTVINFGSSPERADSLSESALGVLRKFAAEGPTADELAKVRENMLRSRETEMRENDFWAGLLQDAALWSDDAAERQGSFAARVAALDAERVRAVARIVLNESNIARFRLLPDGTRQEH